MTKKRKRAPGGGRKPDPNRKLKYSIAIHPDAAKKIESTGQTVYDFASKLVENAAFSGK